MFATKCRLLLRAQCHRKAGGWPSLGPQRRFCVGGWPTLEAHLLHRFGFVGRLKIHRGYPQGMQFKITASRLIRFAKKSNLVIEVYAQLAVRIFAFLALLVELFRVLVR